MKQFDKQKIYQLFKNSFIEGLDYVSNNFDENKVDMWEDQKFHLGIFYPSQIGNLIPFYWSPKKKLFNYSFWLKNPKGDYFELDSFKKLREELLKDDNYCKHFSLGDHFPLEKDNISYKNWLKRYEEIAFEERVGSFIDHYKYKYRTFKFNEKRFKKMFDLWYDYLKSNNLKYDIWIPIIYNRFETDTVKLAKNIFIKKLSVEQQVSRNMFTTSQSLQGTKSFIIRGCTHAIVIKDWSLTGNFLTEHSIPNSIYKLNQNEKFINYIDTIIGSINLVSGIETGIFQIFIEPKNWVRKYKYKYITRLTSFLKKYPVKYEESGWTDEGKIIKKSHYAEIRKSIKLISNQSNKRILFAISKLNEITTKTLDREIIFGATVAMESLLCSDSQSEITYRLATRGAFLCTFSKFENWTPNEINQLLKKLYKYRSGVAHGKSDKELVRIRKIQINHKQLDLLEFSVKFLRHVILFFLKNENLIKTEKGKIDSSKLDEHFYGNITK